MKFLFRSFWGEVTPVALRVQAEGHEVQILIDAPEAKTVGDGLVRKAVDLGRAVQWSDIVVYESNMGRFPDEAEKVRQVRPVFGSSKLAGRLENDRMFALEEARKAGLRVSDDVREFSGPTAWSKARRFLQEADQDTTFVWKPNGEAPVQTYVAHDIRELERMIPWWQNLYAAHHKEPSFILVPRIEGVEVSTEGWWDGKHFGLLNHTIERNRLMAGDLGEKTGCMGNVTWLAPESPLAKALIEPLGQMLGDAYRGPIDVNSIIETDNNEPMFLEFTPRFGYDAIFAFMELLDGVGQTIFDCAVGRLGDRVADPSKRFAGSYRATIPPFPEPPAKEDEGKAVGVPIFGLKPDDKTIGFHWHFTEVRLNGQDELETSGPDGFVMAVSAAGQSPAEAMQAAYKRGKPLHIPCMRWRNDLDSAIQRVYNSLEQSGWLRVASSNRPRMVLFGRPVTRRFG